MEKNLCALLKSLGSEETDYKIVAEDGISSAINAQNGNGWLKYFGLD